MGFNSAFKGLKHFRDVTTDSTNFPLTISSHKP